MPDIGIAQGLKLLGCEGTGVAFGVVAVDHDLVIPLEPLLRFLCNLLEVDVNGTREVPLVILTGQKRFHQMKIVSPINLLFEVGCVDFSCHTSNLRTAAPIVKTTGRQCYYSFAASLTLCPNPTDATPVTILPGLTSTRKERIPAFVRDLAESDVRAIALFPTLLTREERRALYVQLEEVSGLRIPHVHLRTDFDEEEMAYLVRRFETELFNIHPQKSIHPFGEVPTRFATQIYVENTQNPPEPEELSVLGGICVDYSHLESARRLGWSDYVATVENQLGTHEIGCCHIAAIREGEPNSWNGGPDHHNYRRLSDFDYMRRYADRLPSIWASLELENSLSEQRAAVEYLVGLLRC